MKRVSVGRPVRVRADDFDDSVLAADRPALVAFTAEWCAPCKWLTPYLDELAAADDGGLLVFTVDTDRAPGIAERYRIGSIPTVVFFRDGGEVARSVGVEPQRLHAIADSLTSADPSA